MEIKKITDAAFRKYGKVVTGIDFTELLNKMQEMPCPADVVYEPSIDALEVLPVYEDLQTICYGESAIQVGYCNGNNYLLNAVEYHRSSEVDIAATDLILLLGSQQDITDDFTYDTSKIEAFLLPKGVGVELYATTLHYAPCNANEDGFRCVIVLPRDTNLPLAKAHTQGEDKLLAAKNKWLIGHKDGGLDASAHIGLIGENISVK